METAIKLRLPHPYLTTYGIFTQSKDDSHAGMLQIRRGRSGKSDLLETDPPEALHNVDLFFTSPKDVDQEAIPVSNNTAWARAKRAPHSQIEWSQKVPTTGQLWLVTYALFTLRPELEEISVSLSGPSSDVVKQKLTSSMLAVNHPPNTAPGNPPQENSILLQRCTFWQGAGSPFGESSVWKPKDPEEPTRSFVLSYTLTTKFPAEKIHTWHPQRPKKPTPGSVIYSRYIPHLDEQFSMVAIDYQNDEHLDLFHKWQNDPRVAKGWNESGTREQHFAYLERMHRDPHQIAILAAFEGVYFAYFEVYWAKEDHIGAYYPALDFDRGRHSLVGNPAYRGRHRVTAWWSSLMHYIFLDDPRTMHVVGEPKVTNTSVLEYDLMTGFSVTKTIDLPHKRSALMGCSRERFFQICPLDVKGGRVGGTDIIVGARL